MMKERLLKENSTERRGMATPDDRRHESRKILWMGDQDGAHVDDSTLSVNPQLSGKTLART